MAGNFELFEFHCMNDDTDHVLSTKKEDYTRFAKIFSSNTKNTCQNLSCQDFFTKYSVAEVKLKDKKSKGKRKTSKDLMDAVNSELTLIESPVKENVINILDNVKMDQKYFIMNSSSGFSYSTSLRRHKERFHRHKTNGINPIYPRIFEDSRCGDSIVTRYVPSNRITDLLLKSEVNEERDVKFLDIELNSMTFIHHHNFSLEKLLIRKFLEIYKVYNNMQSELNDCHKNIKIYRETKNNLKVKLLKVDSKKENVLFDSTFRNYVKKLLDSKDALLDRIKKYKEIINKIISLWSDVLMVREKTGMITTEYNIYVTKTVLNDDEYKQKWQEAYNQEIIDIIDKLEYDFVSKYIEYKQNKYGNKHDKSKNLHKPKLIIDDDIVKKDVEKVLEMLVAREEIEVELKIHEKHKRKNISLDAATYIFQIFVDDNFVCESDRYKSNGKYEFDLFECCSIQILPHNEELVIVLFENYEKRASYTVKLSEIKTGIHNENKEIIFHSDLRIEPNSTNVGSGFSIKEIASVSGVRLKSSNLFKDQLFTKYVVNTHCRWSGKFDENHKAKIKKYKEISKKIYKLFDVHEKPSFEMLNDVMENIYEKHASGDSNLTGMLKNLCNIKVKPQSEGFMIEDNTTDVVRFKLLWLRNSGKYSQLNNKRIPLLSNQISTEQLQCLQNSDENDLKSAYIDSIKHINLDQIEKQRYIGYKYILDLNKKIIQNLNDNLLKKTYRDVVCNFKDLSIRSIFDKGNNIVSFEHVHGSRQFLDLSQVREQELIVKIYRAFNLPDRMKSILSEESLNEKDNEHVAGIKMKSLRPFVRVAFKENCEQTTTAVGCYPAWNQTLQINLRDASSGVIHINLYDEVKNISEDYIDEDVSLHSRTVHYKYYNKWLGGLEIPLNAVLSVGKLQGTFKLHTPSVIFGYENTSDYKTVFQNLKPEISQIMKKDCAFLSLQISVKTPIHANKYKHSIVTNDDDDYIIKYLNKFITNYTKEFPSRNISLTFIDSAGQSKCVTQFLQPIIPPDCADFSRNVKRVESALSKTSGFSKSSSSSQAKTEKYERTKDFDVERAEVATPSYGRISDFCTTERDSERLIFCCARYVSLIPIYNDECYAVTLMGSELLQVLHGSPLDHTLLLASYLLYLGIKCWVVVGSNLQGLDSYVLVKYNVKLNKPLLESDYVDDESRNKWFSKSKVYSWFIIDAITAEKYEIRDFSCPLKTVNYVFNNENIWVNMQSMSTCECISFNFSKSSEWQAVFDKSIFIASLSTISDRSIYNPTRDVESLREKVEAKIKAKVQKWRATTKTVWNRYCSALLRELIPQWESWAVNPDQSKPSLGQRLKQLMITYKIYGFPLNMPFVNMKTSLSAIKSTALHMHDDPSLEFGLAVEIFPYPNNVISVWVFFVSIARI